MFYCACERHDCRATNSFPFSMLLSFLCIYTQ